jgi:hypothetical protein
VAWERRVSHHGQPLIDLSLFGSANFTRGTILATVVSFAMFGLIFTTPQYFQAVLGATLPSGTAGADDGGPRVAWFSLGHT